MPVASSIALKAATGIAVMLRKFEVQAVSEGEDAQGEALVYVEHNERSYHGTSVSTNIIESSVRAFLEVINRIETSRNTPRPQHAQRPADVREAQAAV